MPPCINPCAKSRAEVHVTLTVRVFHDLLLELCGSGLVLCCLLEQGIVLRVDNLFLLPQSCQSLICLSRRSRDPVCHTTYRQFS